MSFYYISLHSEPFMQHELAMRLQLLATQNIGSRPFTTALHFRRYKKNQRQEKRIRRLLSSGRKSIGRLLHRLPPPDYTTVNNPHRELQNYNSSPTSLLVMRSRICFLVLLQRCTTIRPLVLLPFEY